MRLLLKSFKTEINPTDEQKNKINRTTGTCRYVYNLFLGVNNVRHKNWIREVSSKAVKQSVMNADGAFKKFFKGKSSYPSYKKKNRSDVKMYFVKNNSTDCISERHRINIRWKGLWQYQQDQPPPASGKAVKAAAEMPVAEI